MLITQMFGVSHQGKSARQPVPKVAGIPGQVKIRHAHNLEQSNCTNRRERQEGNQAASLNVVGYVHHQKTGRTPSDNACSEVTQYMELSQCQCYALLTPRNTAQLHSTVGIGMLY